jgi:hypothetical protein
MPKYGGCWNEVAENGCALLLLELLLLLLVNSSCDAWACACD